MTGAEWAEIIKLIKVIVHTWWSHLSSLKTTTWAAAAVPGDFCFLLLSLSPNRYDIHIRIKLVIHVAITKRQWATILLIRTPCSICLEMLWITIIHENACCRLVMNVSVIYCHGMLSCIILCTCLLGKNAFSVLHYTIKVTLHYYVTSLWDSLCLKTFAQGFMAVVSQLLGNNYPGLQKV